MRGNSVNCFHPDKLIYSIKKVVAQIRLQQYNLERLTSYFRQLKGFSRLKISTNALMLSTESRNVVSQNEINKFWRVYKVARERILVEFIFLLF